MNQSTKLLLMFCPLILLLGATFWVVDELQHPVREQDHCQVVGTGPAVAQLKQTRPVLYRQSDSTQFDVGLSCQKMGLVIINDQDSFTHSLGLGSKLQVTAKHYSHLPTLWKLAVES